jgi:hypothetical protein
MYISSILTIPEVMLFLAHVGLVLKGMSIYQEILKERRRG